MSKFNARSSRIIFHSEQLQFFSCCSPTKCPDTFSPLQQTSANSADRE
jgi:hypothetical protein